MLLASALLLVSAGWLFERRHYSDQLSNTLDDAGAVSSTISGAIWTNLIYSELDTRTESENADRKVSLLHTNIVTLFVNLGETRYSETGRETSLGNYSVSHDERRISVTQAGKSLALLELLDVDNYQSSYFKIWDGGPPFDGLIEVENNRLTEPFRQFIQSAIDDYKSTSPMANTAG